MGPYGRGVRGGYLVQFDGPIGGAQRGAIEQAGGSIKGYVPMMTLEVVMTEQERAAVERIAGVRWVSVYQPSFKVTADLLASANANPGARLKLQVSLFPREGDAGVNSLAGLGAPALKLDRGRSFEVAEVEVPAAQLNGLIHLPLVRFVEPVYERVELNDRARFHTGLTDIANDTFTAGIDPSLDGKDEASGFQVKYGHFDGGMQTSHPDFSTATITVEPAGNPSSSPAHGTHTAGSIVGDGGESLTVPQTPPGSGSVSANKFRGVTPQAALHHIPFNSNYTDRQIFERESEVGAQISSNSWGYSSCIGPFCSPITNYNTNAATWDAGVWDADDDAAGEQPLIVFFSAGNSGNGNSAGCGTSSGDQIGTPGAAKNVITVGASETDRGCNSNSNNTGEVSYFSSRGPVDPDGTGRGLFKPEVVNLGGEHILSVESTGSGGTGRDAPAACSDTGPNYRYEAGTSMSNPLTAGLGGVLYQDLKVNLGVSSPKPSLVKALLVNGAVDLAPGGGCDYTFNVAQSSIAEGWGRVNAKNSLYGPNGSPSQRNIAFQNEETANAVATGETYTTTVSVNSGTPLKITLVWTDYPAAAGAGSPLVVNDLDLEVDAPGGVTYRGNNFSGNWSTTGGGADRYNVVENVFIQSPAAGTYTIRVKGFQVSQDQELGKTGVNQDFSLVWSGSLGSIAPVHDVAVTSISAPASVLVNTIQAVTVGVANEGNQTETFTVTLTDSLASAIGPAQTPTLAAGGATTLTFSWTPSQTGNHSLTATAGPVTGETDFTDNAKPTTSDVRNAVRDVAVTSITAPANVTQGNTVNITVVVANQGDTTETFDVTVTSTGGTIGNNPQTVSNLAPGATATLTFPWNTTGAPTGTHTLTAAAATVPTETDTADNTRSTNSTVVSTPPNAPTNLAVGTVNRTWADLQWSDNSNNEETFRIERCTGAGCTNFLEVASVGANTTSYRNNGLARRTTYRWRVRARNAFGDSAYTNEVQATTR